MRKLVQVPRKHADAVKQTIFALIDIARRDGAVEQATGKSTHESTIALCEAEEALLQQLGLYEDAQGGK